MATQNSRHFYCAARTARQSDLNSNVWWKGTPNLVASLKRIRADWLPPFGTIPPEPVWPWNSEERAKTELLDIARGATVRGGNLTEKSSGSTEFTRPRIHPLFRNTPNGRTGDGLTFGGIIFAETEKRAGTYFELENERPRESACSTTHTVETRKVPEMLAASICHEIYYTVLPSTIMSSRVPRCLFGRPNSRETMEMLQEALDADRSKFARRWGVDPCSEDKENNYQRRNNERSDRSPGKKRSNPYSRQTSIHDYWRARKVCDVNKKPLTVDVSKQNVESSKATKVTTTTTTTTITKTA